MGEGDGAGDQGALSFEEERQAFSAAAVRDGWRAVARLAGFAIAACFVVAVLAHALMLLAQARSAHEAPAFPYGAIEPGWRGNDPTVEAYARSYAGCGDVGDEDDELEESATQGIDDHCHVRRLLVFGADPEIVRLARVWAGRPPDERADNPLPWLTDRVLVPALADAVGRADWGSCKRFSVLTIALLDTIDPPASWWTESLNEALLLATLCSEPVRLIAAPELARTIGLHVTARQHLKPDFLRSLQAQRTDALAQHWLRLLTGIGWIRAGEMDRATQALGPLDDDRVPPALRDLARLQLARAAYWTFELARGRGEVSAELRSTTLERLSRLMEGMRASSLQRDISEYGERIEAAGPP